MVKEVGNDDHFILVWFPGLKNGDCWCVVPRGTRVSFEEGSTFNIFKTNIKTLELILEELKNLQ